MSSPIHRRVPWRGIALALACVLAFLLVPLPFGLANLATKLAKPASPPAYSGSFPAPTYDPAKKVAVVVVGSDGAEINDTLTTFEVLARSGVFNVYVVAPERSVLPLASSGPTQDSGLDFVPSFSFASYAASIGKDPDLIAIPAGAGPDTTVPPVLAWIRAHAGPNTTLLGICVGSKLLADTGLLDGHAATQNTQWFDYVAARHPTVRLVRDVRYVDDGAVITSTNVAGGIDASLHAVDRFAGRAVALDVARQLGYTHTGYLDDPRFQYPASPLTGVMINSAYEWPQEKLGVLLADGVSEFALAGLLDPYSASLAARAEVFAPQRAPVVSRDGLVFLPRYDFSNVPAPDRVVVPGGEQTAARQQAIAAWQRQRPDRPVLDIHRAVGQGVSAYDATLQDMARSHNAMVASSIGATLFVPTDTLRLPAAAWPIESLGAPVALGLLGVGLVLLIARIPRRRRAAGHRSAPIGSDDQALQPAPPSAYAGAGPRETHSL